MAEQMVMMELLTNNCGNECKGMLNDELKKRIKIIIPGIFAVALIISLCVVVSVLHQKKKDDTLIDCVLRPTLKTDLKTCSFVEQYPLSNEIYVRICVNETVQIDIRRFHNGKPGDEGITLTRTQWQYLKASVNHMDVSILKHRKVRNNKSGDEE